MRKILIVIDMQNDFIDGSLGTPEAVGIVEHCIRGSKGWQIREDIDQLLDGA